MNTLNKIFKRGLKSSILTALRKIVIIFLMEISDYSMRLSCKKKIRKIHKNLKLKKNKSDIELLNIHVKKWRKLSHYVNTKYIQVYKHCSGIKSENFIPEDVYYNIVEPCLNYYPIAKAESDKNNYQKGKFAEYFPKTILRNINGVFYNENYQYVDLNDKSLLFYLKPYKEIIVKPSIESGKGKSLRLFEKTDGCFICDKGEKINCNLLNNAFKQNFVIQERLLQHHKMKMFNKSSLNTIRVNTYRSVVNESIIILNSVVRFGIPGSLLSNTSLGGGSIKINNNGFMEKFGINHLNGARFTRVSNIKLENPFEIPKYEKIKEIAKGIANEFPYSRLLGIDFVIDIEENIRILEVNNSSLGINNHQMTGGPYFHTYTDDVIEYCLNKYDRRVRRQKAVLNIV